MSRVQRRIGVVPFGEVPEVALKVIAANIVGAFNLESDVLPALANPASAYDERRLQYDAGIVLEALKTKSFEPYEKVIGVLEVDLFVPILTYVFGEAEQGRRYALVSLYRLRRNPDGSTPPVSLLLERAAKVALHELGHLFDLFHCQDKACLMHFTGGVDKLDETPLYLCRYCTKFLHDKLQRSKIGEDDQGRR